MWVASRWCSIVRYWGVFAVVVGCGGQKMWRDSLTQVGSDGQHPARRKERHPTA